MSDKEMSVDVTKCWNTYSIVDCTIHIKKSLGKQEVITLNASW
jgi:hypothetical protein